jgi:hypothetical protein
MNLEKEKIKEKVGVAESVPLQDVQGTSSHMTGGTTHG